MFVRYMTQKPYIKSLLLICGIGFSGIIIVLASTFLYLDPQIPSAETYRHYQLETPLRIYSADGALLAEFGNRRLIPISISDVPQTYKDAVVFTEDKRFYEHRGVDFISLANDFLKLLVQPETRTGASTITMQIPRNVADLSREQTFVRKFKEILLANKIEQELSKDENLELYINVVPFGKHAYGLQAASYTYYDKPVNELDLAQIAMLAGVPKRPEAGNPINGPEWALNRRNLVLRRMLENDAITEPQYTEALNAPITAQVFGRDLDLNSPYPAEWVRRDVVNLLGKEAYSGYVVHTTIDSNHQRSAQRALRQGLIDYDRRHGYRGPEESISGFLSLEKVDLLSRLGDLDIVNSLEQGIVTEVEEQSATILRSDESHIEILWQGMNWARRYLSVDSRGPRPKNAKDILKVGDLIRFSSKLDGSYQLEQIPSIQGALVGIEPQSGGITAVVGGFDFYENQYNHATQAHRQPGSSFKPFVYSAAIENGITPASIFLDAPLVFEDRNLETTYRPRNDSGRYNGPTRLRQALYRSINLVSMRVLLEIGAGKVLQHAKAIGFDTDNFPRSTQLAIGGGTMTLSPLQMATAYATLANGGFQVDPYIIERIESLDGSIVFNPTRYRVCDSCGTSTTRPIESNDTNLSGPHPVLTDNDEIAKSRFAPAKRVVDERNVFIINTMLRDVIQRGTGRKALTLNRKDLAGKTGTTNDATDTWFSGFHKNIATSVWVGFSDYSPVGAREYGSTAPLPIWIDFMGSVLENVPEVPLNQPEGVVSIKIDPSTGRAADPNQSDAIFEYFLKENPPLDSTTKTFLDNGNRNILAEDIF